MYKNRWVWFIKLLSQYSEYDKGECYILNTEPVYFFIFYILEMVTFFLFSVVVWEWNRTECTVPTLKSISTVGGIGRHPVEKTSWDSANPLQPVESTGTQWKKTG